MANGRNMRAHKKGDKAFTESFTAIPKSVLYGQAYTALNKVERALFLEFALQYTGRNNGRLLCSVKQLKKRSGAISVLAEFSRDERLVHHDLSDLSRACRSRET